MQVSVIMNLLEEHREDEELLDEFCKKFIACFEGPGLTHSF